MSIRVVCVGKLRQSFCREGAGRYLEKLRPYSKVELVEVRAGPGELAGVARALAGCREVLCCTPGGREVTSEELARLLEEAMTHGRVPIGFAVGGADGLPPGFLAPAARPLAFSRLTFPHELFRVILLEQLYRAFTILRGEPYHSGH